MKQYLKLFLFAGLFIFNSCNSKGDRYDRIIRNGMLYDGSGAPGIKADIGIRNDTIAFIGDLSGATASEETDAGGQAAECLDRRGDFLRGQAVIAMAPLGMHQDQPPFGEAREMPACRRRHHSGDAGELAGGHRLATHQCGQHARACRVGRSA